MELEKIVSFLGLENVDSLATMLGKSRATVYRYGKPENDPGFSEPPYSILKSLMLRGVPVEMLFGIPCPCSKTSGSGVDRRFMDEVLTRLEALEQARNKPAKAG